MVENEGLRQEMGEMREQILTLQRNLKAVVMQKQQTHVECTSVIVPE